MNEIIGRLRETTRAVTVMEVCGTHTSAIVKNGIKSLISPSIRLVSGPGCPVCVTAASVIDGLIDCAENAAVLSFGDMFRVTGTKSSLSDAKANGADVRLMYSPFDVIKLAEESPSRLFVLAAVGFETTAPVYAALLDELVKRGIANVKLYTALKTMPEALEYICENESVDAFICPGHVSVILGAAAYNGLCGRYKKPFVITGFEPSHILSALDEILAQIENAVPHVANLYPEVVSEAGQLKAQGMIEKYFDKYGALWRGIGTIKGSGYVLKPEYAHFSANNRPESESPVNSACRCTDVILGRIKPAECPLFRTVCTPQNPEGACMVSPEGACGIVYRHGGST